MIGLDRSIVKLVSHNREWGRRCCGSVITSSSIQPPDKATGRSKRNCVIITQVTARLIQRARRLSFSPFSVRHIGRIKRRRLPVRPLAGIPSWEQSPIPEADPKVTEEWRTKGHHHGGGGESDNKQQGGIPTDTLAESLPD